MSLSQQRARNQSDDALSARARFVLRFSLEDESGKIKFRVLYDTLNIKSSKKYEPFAPSATLPEREEEL